MCAQFSTEINARITQLRQDTFCYAEDVLAGSINNQEVGSLIFASSTEQANAFRAHVGVQRSLRVEVDWLTPDARVLRCPRIACLTAPVHALQFVYNLYPDR